MKVKRRNADGTLGGWESVVPGKETDEQKIKRLEQENKLLEQQLLAQSARSDFVEDLVAELATEVYK